MLGPARDDNHAQQAVRVLAAIRMTIVEYRMTQADDWRVDHARTASMIDVIGGLIADSKATDAHWRAADKTVVPLRDEISRLKDELAESKRPFSAQMEMQNRRIIALTAEVDRLRIKEYLK